MVFKLAKMVAKHLGFFYMKICRQELKKIAQSGHTDQHDDDLDFRVGGIVSFNCLHPPLPNFK